MTAGQGTGRGTLVRVLVADDSRVFRAITVETLQGHGLEVFQAANGSEALHLLEEKRPQLVILDALMPILTGFGVLEKIRESVPDYHPVVFVVTAVYKSRRWEMEAKSQYQVAEYLEKPIEPEDLVRAIGRHFPEFFGLGDGTP